MNAAQTKGLVAGLLLGVILAWHNWPATATIETHLTRSVAQVIGAALALWFVGYLIGRNPNHPPK